ncbi:MAG: DUF1329 domain-containing protein [Sterolibacterium sp.]
MIKHTLITAALLAAFTASVPTLAAVTADEAAKLKTTLTPMGGEKAANKDGSIPVWDGGITAPPAGYKAGDPRPDPFPAEKPTLQITAKNEAQAGDKLSDGMRALLKKYPESFRIDVYPSHRTAAAPQWVYDNTAKNAVKAKTTHNGVSLEGAYAGVPFPIPKDGAEVMWNHLLRWRGESVEIPFRVWVGSADGKRTMAVAAKDDHQFPYWYKDGSGDKGKNTISLLLRQIQTEPPFKAGEQILIHDPLDLGAQERQAWQYLSGQRRVRRAPTIAFDTPDFVASGMNYFDEVFMFLGSLERYDWKLVGKREMYVPYNNNRFLLAKTDEVLAPHHLNPDKLRWELHRVWVVDATLASGKRHAVPKKRFYVDEDSWSVLLVDGYDAEGKLWRAQHAVPFVAPDIPAVVSTTFTVFNLQAGSWLVNNLYNDQKSPYKVMPLRPETYFSADALAGAGMR